MKSRAYGFLVSQLLVLAVIACGCGGGDSVTADAPDAATDAASVSGDGAADASDADGAARGPAPCAPCRLDIHCAEGAMCLALADGELACGHPCESNDDCADLGYEATCEEEIIGQPHQCVPAANTCVVSLPGALCTSSRQCSGTYNRCADPETLGSYCTTACVSDADCPMGLHRCRQVGDDHVCVKDEVSAGDRCQALTEAHGVPACVATHSCGIDDLPALERFTEGELAADSDCTCLMTEPTSMLDDAVAAVGRTRCTLGVATDMLNMFSPLISQDPYRLAISDRSLADWPRALTGAQEQTRRLDTAVGTDTPLSLAIARAAKAADIDVSAVAVGSAALGDALESFVTATGGTASRSEIDTQVAGLSTELAEALAQIVNALEAGYYARERALARIGDDRDYQYLRAVWGVSRWQADLTRADVRGAIRGDIDLNEMASGAAAIAHAIEAADLSRFADHNATLTLMTPAGLIAVRGSDDNTYESATWNQTALLIDLGGDDTYRFGAGSNASADNGLAITIDLAGTDTYAYTAVPVTADTNPEGGHRLPSDFRGRFAPPEDSYWGPISMSDVNRQGSGRLGIGMLIDLGDGDDRYQSHHMSQGYGEKGVGLLYDAAGDDVYECESDCQGSAQFGVGILLDGEGADEYYAYQSSQGFGYVRGAGLLYDGGGDDTYVLVPSDVLYSSAQRPHITNISIGQGAGFGRRDDSTGYYMAGGIGMLRDVSGSDHYTGGVFAQGVGYWFGTGFLVDSAGNDTYDAEWYAQGAAAHYATAVAIDEAGDDRYNENSLRQNATLGCGHDFSVAWFVDGAGDDVYMAPSMSLGMGNDAGGGFFVDVSGVDSYTSAADTSMGDANYADGLPIRINSGSFGFFFDANGLDSFSRPTVSPVANNSLWTQHVREGAGEQGVGVDRTAGELGFVATVTP